MRAALPFAATLQPASAMSRWAAAWLPPCCLVCGGPGTVGLDLCDACLSILPAMHRRHDGSLACMRCGEPAGETVDGRSDRRVDGRSDIPVGIPVDGAPFAPPVVCSACRRRGSPFRDVIAPWRFAPPIDGWVRTLKHDGAPSIARVLGAAIARAVIASSTAQPGAPSSVPGGASPCGANDAPPLLIPVPMHAQRLRQRGFNQAEAIARWVGRDLGLPVHARAAVRVVDTDSLAERSRAERQLVIRGAFRVHADIAERQVVLIDDVLTSGATAGELARECHDTGAASVSLWVAARTCVAFDSSRASTGGNVA